VESWADVGAPGIEREAVVSRGAGRYLVLVDDWQFECCGEPFGIGDEVAWTLELIDGSRYPAEFHVTLSGELFELEREVEPSRVARPDGISRALRVGQLTVAVAPFGDPPISGVLHEDHHDGLPASLPPTRGVVTSIAVRSERFTIEGNTWTPIPRSTTTRKVERTPQGFRFRGSSGSTGESETGLLVGLRVL
jgi:hypothetical protein